jgi:hypothetical protein
VDGDKDLDLLVGNEAFQNFLLLNDGKGTFTDATANLPRIQDDTRALAPGDVDGDGDLDLLVGNTGKNTGQQNHLFLNDGKGKFTDATRGRLIQILDCTNALSLADLDMDGDLDLLVVNEDETLLYLNNGKGYFTDFRQGMFRVDQGGAALALGDVDLDGDQDFAVGRLDLPDRIYFNLTRQVFAPGMARLGLPYHVELHARDATGSAQQVFYPMLSSRWQNTPIPPYGTLGLAGGVMIFPQQLISPVTAMTTLTIQVPPDPALAGARIFLQGLVVHLPSNRVRLTNTEGETVLKL